MRFKFSLCIIITMMLIFSTNVYGQRIAVLEFKPGVGVSLADVDGLSSIFVTYFSPENYTLVERSQIDRVIDEQNFQRSSLTENQMVKIGEILNLSKVVVGNINIIMGEYNIDVRVINIETGTIAATEGASFGQGSYREGMKNLALNLANKLSGKPISDNTLRHKENVPNEEETVKKGYTKNDLIKKGFRFREGNQFVTINGVDGPAKIQTFIGGEYSEDSFGYTQYKLDKSFYYSGESSNGYLNGLVMLLADGSEKHTKETFLCYVCDGQVAYPLISVYKYFWDESEPGPPQFKNKWHTGTSIEEPTCSYGFNKGFSMDDELIKVYGPIIATESFQNAVLDGSLNIEDITNSFNRFMMGGEIISPRAWQ